MTIAERKNLTDLFLSSDLSNKKLAILLLQNYSSKLVYEFFVNIIKIFYEHNTDYNAIVKFKIDTQIGFTPSAQLFGSNQGTLHFDNENVSLQIDIDSNHGYVTIKEKGGIPNLSQVYNITGLSYNSNYKLFKKIVLRELNKVYK